LKEQRFKKGKKKEGDLAYSAKIQKLGEKLDERDRNCPEGFSSEKEDWEKRGEKGKRRSDKVLS